MAENDVFGPKKSNLGIKKVKNTKKLDFIWNLTFYTI